MIPRIRIIELASVREIVIRMLRPDSYQVYALITGYNQRAKLVFFFVTFECSIRSR